MEHATDDEEGQVPTRRRRTWTPLGLLSVLSAPKVDLGVWTES